MKTNSDNRLDKEIFKSFIGKKFIKYRCDPFLFTDSVTGIVGLYIGNSVYELRNEQESVIYFDVTEDIAVWQIRETEDSQIRSFFLDTKQIDSPVNQIITGISMINEHQCVSFTNQKYDRWETRAVIFHLENRDICFEKDESDFSEEIEIRRGYNLLNEYPKRNNFFLDEWEGNASPTLDIEIITL